MKLPRRFAAGLALALALAGPGRAWARGGASAWLLQEPGREPLRLAALEGAAGPLCPLLPAAEYAGLKLRWAAPGRLLELEAPGGRRARLALGEPWLYLQGRRLPLPAGLQLKNGAPALGEASLRALLAALGAPRLELLAQAAPPPAPAPAPSPRPSRSPTPLVAARSLGGEILTIVVDAGHGGQDPGASGKRGLKEKDVCLDIARRLREQLLKLSQQGKLDPRLRVVLTRESDEFITLRDRTELANKVSADLYVSIHNNASRNRESHGYQVYTFDSNASGSYLEGTLKDLLQRENNAVDKYTLFLADKGKSVVQGQSQWFALKVREAMRGLLPVLSKGKRVRDDQGESFYVLGRTEMPAILVEVAFITNPAEERLLGQAAFREKVALRLAQGIADFRELVRLHPEKLKPCTGPCG